MAEKEEPVVKKRIIDFYESRGLTCREFSRKTGVNETTFYRLDQEMQVKNLIKVLRAFPEIDAREMLLGESSSCGNEEANELPVIPFDAVAGHLTENFDDGYAESIAIPKSVTRGADFAIRVDGDSMTPRFQSGELLLVKKVSDPSFFQWGKCYVLATTQGCVVKRLYPDREDDNSIVCHSDNTDNYPDYTVSKRNVFGIGLVVGHIGHD